MNEILHTPVSGLHVSAAMLAVCLGTMVLLRPKGTRFHKITGYAYTACMLIVNATAFRIFHLFGHFGIVHWGALASLLTLLGGIGASVLKRPKRQWKVWHEALMGWSVTGLYAAGLVEATYRLFPPIWFWWVSLSLAGLILLAGSLLILTRTTIYPRLRSVCQHIGAVNRNKIGEKARDE